MRILYLSFVLALGSPFALGSEELMLNLQGSGKVNVEGTFRMIRFTGKKAELRYQELRALDGESRPGGGGIVRSYRTNEAPGLRGYAFELRDVITCKAVSGHGGNPRPVFHLFDGLTQGSLLNDRIY